MRLTDEEREFLRSVEGGVFHELNRFLDQDVSASPVEAAEYGAAGFVQQLIDRYPNRIQRLLALRVLAQATEKARDDLLTELIGEDMASTTIKDGEMHTGAHPVQSWEVGYLATAAGLHPNTIRAKEKKLWKATIDDALRAANYDLGLWVPSTTRPNTYGYAQAVITRKAGEGDEVRTRPASHTSVKDAMTFATTWAAEENEPVTESSES